MHAAKKNSILVSGCQALGAVLGEVEGLGSEVMLPSCHKVRSVGLHVQEFQLCH